MLNETCEELCQLLDLPAPDAAGLFGLAWEEDPQPRDGTRRFLGRLAWCLAAALEIETRPRTGSTFVQAALPYGIWRDPGSLTYGYVPVGGPLKVRAVRPCLAELLAKNLDEVVAVRTSQSRVCRYCKSRTPTEHLLDDECCYGCGSRFRGIVY